MAACMAASNLLWAPEVYLLAANTTGYGQPSVSLLRATSTGYASSLGAYVPTAADGSFTISGDYSCTPNTQVYLYSLGGSQVRDVYDIL